MAVQKIVTMPNSILTTKTKAVEKITEDVIKLGQDLVDTVKHAKEPEGAGLASTQIGSDLRMCVVRQFLESRKGNDYETQDFVLINPKIISRSKETEIEYEGCLSVPDQFGRVQRYLKIKVRAMTLAGEQVQINASGFFARVIQHEIDHLDGILFTDRVIGKVINEAEFDKILAQGGI